MKKGLMFVMAFVLFFAVTAGTVDAKPRGGIKSPKKSFTQTPNKSQDNVNASNPGTKSPGATAGTTQKRGFNSGGGFLKGMMIGGLAGMLFGSMFAGMGFMGNILGLLVNLFAIFMLIVAIRGIFMYFKNRRKPHTPNDRGRY
ncbi:hypothetical protein [Paenibacillus spongiae]|uniref:Preprotein translocase subunit Tim44 n=1 Tax=Paenibacillus spongiae TaxID=2909671 RepID=A0ABY5S1G7_9BACL|nr:hypothetical protein [Paenibacillus spongiae]UVI27716.1 hypothetical protein L1F29_19845 [Paenibacillus spongiae]